jgi:hypothetical protein
VDRDVFGKRIASQDETVVLTTVLDTRRQTQLAVHKGPVAWQRTARRHRTMRRLRTPDHATLTVIDHGLVSASFGLGMLSAAVQQYYGWRSSHKDLENFDAADSTGRRNTLMWRGVAVGRPPNWTETVTGRAGMCSPGRPPVARWEDQQRFWAAIARGLSSEDAGVEAGVSPAVGSRWFRNCGGTLVYRATLAQWHRDRRAARPKAAKLAVNDQLRAYGVSLTGTGQTLAL